MSSSEPSNEKVIPLSVVFITVGTIILLTVIAIWILIPARMPQPLYDILEPYLPQTAVVNPTTTTHTATSPAATATIPVSGTINLLPETPLDAIPNQTETLITNTGPAPGQPVRIVIPVIDVDAPINQVGLEAIEFNGETYYQWQVPKQQSAGWHNNSARLGQEGNTVLNGHHNIHGEVFRDLVDLDLGDEIVMYDANQTFTYEITVKEILAERDQSLETRLANAQWIESTNDERVTLVTCWPYTDNSHRVIIVAQPVTTTDS